MTSSRNSAFPATRSASTAKSLVSQSGAICTAVLDWAEENGVGFSSVVSTGIGADLDFGDYLDYLVSDPKTKAILLYIEGITDARRFMSSVRAAARMKPVIALKVGRHAAGAVLPALVFRRHPRLPSCRPSGLEGGQEGLPHRVEQRML